MNNSDVTAREIDQSSRHKEAAGVRGCRREIFGRSSVRSCGERVRLILWRRRRCGEEGRRKKTGSFFLFFLLGFGSEHMRWEKASQVLRGEAHGKHFLNENTSNKTNALRRENASRVLRAEAISGSEEVFF